jgi:drug/metabolite transporter (DMT)-like permease
MEDNFDLIFWSMAIGGAIIAFGVFFIFLRINKNATKRKKIKMQFFLVIALLIFIAILSWIISVTTDKSFGITFWTQLKNPGVIGCMLTFIVALISILKGKNDPNAKKP